VRDVLAELSAVLKSDGSAAMATVVRTWKSAPRPAGASMLVTEAGEAVGSVSGGCVEGALYDLGHEVLADGQARFETYGVSDDDAFAVMADGKKVETVEGMGSASELHPVQEGFKQEHGLQCGFCTPGMMLASKALLERNPNPTEDEVRWALSGNLCRCTGYQNIVKSVLWAAEKMRNDQPQEA